MNKPYKNIDEQIQILKDRKMVILNYNFAKKVLKYENYYYVINGYKNPFITSNNGNDVYKHGTSFNELVALYSFDRKLREILLPDLLRIEHNIKAIIIDIFSKYHGEDHNSYLKPESFNTEGVKNKNRTDYLILDLLKLIDKQKSKHNAIQHYVEKYGSVPLWVLSKVMTFGKINSFFACMKRDEKLEVAAAFNLAPSQFKSLIDFIAVFRNKCAHGERIYCHIKDQKRAFSIHELPIHSLLVIPKNNKGYKYGTQDILALLIAMKYFLQPNRYQTLIRKIDYALNRKLSSRLYTISCDEIRKIMGLKNNWKQLGELPK